MYYLADDYVMVIHSLKTLKLNHERLHLAKIALERNTINGGNVIMLSKRYMMILWCIYFRRKFWQLRQFPFQWRKNDTINISFVTWTYSIVLCIVVSWDEYTNIFVAVIFCIITYGRGLYCLNQSQAYFSTLQITTIDYGAILHDHGFIEKSGHFWIFSK